MMPFLAILRHDLGVLLGSWLVRIWVAAAALLTLLTMMTNWAPFQTAPLIASLFVPWLIFPWFVVVMVLGVNPITGSRAEALADGFLSRPIARYEYLLAIWAARVVVVLGNFLIVTVPAIAVAALAKRAGPGDQVTVYGVLASLVVVTLVLTLQVSLAFLMGTLLRKTLLAVVVLLFLWYPVNVLLHAFKLEAFSPISLNQALPTLLRQPWRQSDPDSAAQDVKLDAEQFQRAVASLPSMLLGGGVPEAQPQKGGFFEQNPFREFSLLKVLLGYGIPTLAAIGLAMLSFWRRDL
jgi:ABC-type transport system involved in multi-copper enzyme maturation permease subunit